ncbi:hypothetical protein JL720_5608 [Aureococcus anophagefferens]|nr:hypothetical protein JL720_5608 [Aureococcus anophagefferens]
MALDMGLFHDPLDTNGVKTLPPISGAFDILGGDPMAGVLTTSQKSVPTLKFDTSAPRVPARRYTSKRARAKADLERTRRAKQETFGPELSLYSGFLDDLSPEGEAAATTHHSLHHFIIWKGKRLHATPEFGAFGAAMIAGRHLHIVGLLEDLCLQKAVTLALVDGAAVDALAKCDLARLKVADLRARVHNMDHVGGEDIFKPSSSTTKHRDRSKAATLIQTVARRVVARKRFLSHRVRRDAAVSIQSQARRKLAVATVLDGIARLRSERATHWDALSARLRRDAAHLAPGAERVEIHVPSLGHSEHVRLDAPRFQLSQAMQIARLCAAADPNTHVVYVSPVELGDELVDYYQRVLSLARGGSGDDDDDADGDPASTPRPGASSRFTVIVPELVRRFPAHFTLASLALYSPSCCRRLYHLSAGRFAVIVPGGPVGWAEKALALRLDVPLLGPDPSRAALYGSRSGAKRGSTRERHSQLQRLRSRPFSTRAKRVLHESDVNIPVGAHDIYDEEDFCVALAKLVAGHLDVARWKFGVDADARAGGASGVAHLDVDDLDVVRDLRHEQRRLTALDRHKGEAAWHHPDVQVLARSKLLRSLRVALAARAVVCYPGKRPEGGAWPSFMALVQRYGGVIEAEPRDVVGHSCVHAFVRPDGVVSVRAAQDVLSTDGYERIVAVHPAAAAPVEALAGATAAVARRLFDRGVTRGIQIFNPTSISPFDVHAGGVVGHFTLHFTAHRSADAGGALRLWATDLELGLNPLAVGHLLHVAVTGRAPRKPAPGAGPAPPADPAKRSYVLVPGFYHPGLAALKYSSFFKLCRLHGIAFDLAERRGPVLLLVDSLASGVVGAVTEGANKLDALRLCHKFLTFVRKHVDTAHLIHHVAGPADRELPDLIHVVNGALRPLEHMISSLAIGPELAAPLIHDRRRLPQPDDAATPV